MIREGRIVLFRFPRTDQNSGKLRPALLLRKLPGPYDDWLICMVSSQLFQCIPGFDEIVDEREADFQGSGLKAASVIRISRIAVVEESILTGAIGNIGDERLTRILDKVSNWIKG